MGDLNSPGCWQQLLFIIPEKFKKYSKQVIYQQIRMGDREELAEKMKQVKAMEQEMASLTERMNTLDAQKNLTQNVVDEEGFPRADLNFGDLAQYKDLKRRFNEINNDHNKLMKEVEKGLFSLHAEFKNDPKVEEEGNVYAENKAKENQVIKEQKVMEEQNAFKKKEPEKEKEYKIEYLTPFAKISLVEEGSPAEKAGVLAGDLISEIGSVTVYEADGIKAIPRVVQEGTALKLVVMRLATSESESKVFNVRGEDRVRVDLVLVPRKWQGRGLLGCKIDPI